MKTEEGSVEIRLPSVLTLTRLFPALLPLRIVRANDSLESLGCRLGLPEGTKTVRVDATRLVDAAPPALALALALPSWLRAQRGGSLEVEIRGPRKPIGTRLGLGDDFAAQDEGVAFDEVARRSFTSIRLAGLSGRGRAELGLVVEKIVTRVQPGDSGLRDDPAWRFLAIFLYEALCNVADHASQASGLSQDDAWVVVSTPEDADLSPAIGASTRPTLKAAVVDLGIGISRSLADAFFRRHGSRARRPGSRQEWEQAHSEILRWALSPFGSRRDTPADWKDRPLAALVWRGLFKARFEAEQLGGVIALLSGIGTAVAQAGSPERCEVLDFDADFGGHRALPGTLLSAEVPLGRKPKLKRRSQGQDTVNPDVVVAVPASARALLQTSGWTRQESVRNYCDAIRKPLLDAWQEVTSGGPAVRPVPCPVICVAHPFVRLSSADIAPPEEDKQAAGALLQIIRTCTFPNALVIHVGLEASREGLTAAQQAYAIDDSDEPSPSLSGAVVSDDGKTRWFVTVDGSPESVLLAQEGQVDLASDRARGRWRLFVGLWKDHMWAMPGEPDSNSTALGLKWHDATLNPTAAKAWVADAIRRLATTLAASERVPLPWYWEERFAPPREVVLTPSGAIVTQFLSVFRLLEEEPVFEAWIRLLARDAAKRMWGGMAPVRILAEEGVSAALVARRIFGAEGGSDDFQLSVVGDPSLSDAKPESGMERAIVFSDALYTGGTLQNTILRARESWEIAGALAIFDLASDSGTRTKEPDPTTLETLCRWRFRPPLSYPALPERTPVLEVNPISGERLSTRETAEAARLNEMMPQDAGAAASQLNAHCFRYGLQRFGGRLHTVRVDLKAVLESAGGADAIAERVSTMLRECGVYDAGIVHRDDASMREHVDGVIKALRSERVARASNVRLFRVEVPTAWEGERQILRREVAGLLSTAPPISDARQAELFPEEAAPLGRYLGVVLDNAAVTGAAIRRLVTALVAEGSQRPVGIVACVVVDRLNPQESRFLSLVGGVGVPGVRFSFSSLVRLQARSYREAKDLYVYQMLEQSERIGGSLGTQLPEEWLRARMASLDRLGRSPEGANETVAFPFADDEGEAAKEVDGERAARLRHLIALQEAGVPVAEHLVRALTETFAKARPELAVVLGLEPDLCRLALFSRALSGDLAAYAARLALGARGPLRTAALASLAAIERRLDATGVAAVTEAAKEAALRPLVVALGVWRRFTGGRTDWLDTLENVGREVALREEGREEGAALLCAARLAKLPMTAKAPVHADPRSLLKRVLAVARARHGLRGFSQWWALREIAQSAERGAPGADEVLGAQLDEVQWAEIRSVFADVLLPATEAVGQLDPESSLFRGKLLTSWMREAIGQLTRIEIQVQKPKAARDRLRSLVSGWALLARMSLSTSVDLLYSQGTSFVTATHADEDGALFDNALPKVCQEARGLVLHQIRRIFGDAETVEIQSGQASEEKRASVGQCLRESREEWWLAGTAMPLVWGAAAKNLRAAAGIVIENIRTHGRTDPDLKVTWREGEGQVFHIYIDNARGPRVRRGGGLGLPQCKNLMKRAGGRADTDEYGDRFRVHLELPTEMYVLPTEE